MKKYLPALGICLALAAGGVQARADKIPAAQAPPPVLKAIQAQIQTTGEPAKEIERETKDGKVIYEVEFTRDGLNRRVKFNEDGTLVHGDRDFRDVTTGPDLNALPAPVRKTLEAQRAGRVVADIDKETSDGQTVYEVEFKEQGPNSRIHIAADGSLVASKSGRGRYVGMQLSETPKVVQDAVKQAAGEAAEIADVDRKTKDGNVVYNVEIRQEGLNRHLQIAESGTILRDSRAGGALAETGERARDTVRRVREKVTDGTVTMSLSQLPDAVQKTIQANGDVAHLKPIKQETKNGTTYYAVEFEKPGRNTRLKVSEDGTIMEDSRK